MQFVQLRITGQSLDTAIASVPIIRQYRLHSYTEAARTNTYKHRHRPWLSQRTGLTARLRLYRECHKCRPQRTTCDAAAEQQSEENRKLWVSIGLWCCCMLCMLDMRSDGRRCALGHQHPTAGSNSSRQQKAAKPAAASSSQQQLGCCVLK